LYTLFDLGNRPGDGINI
jgi:hypothetical protein